MTAPNAPNASNASTGGPGRNVKNPLPGDDDYLNTLWIGFESGHLTEAEWHQLSAVHQRLEGATA